MGSQEKSTPPPRAWEKPEVVPVEDEVDSLDDESATSVPPKQLLDNPELLAYTPPANPVYVQPDEWQYRPYATSQVFTEPETEELLLDASLHNPPNYLAWLGLVFAIAALIVGLNAPGAGLFVASVSLLFSMAGLWAARHGARRFGVAVIAFATSVLAIIWAIQSR